MLEAEGFPTDDVTVTAAIVGDDSLQNNLVEVTVEVPYTPLSGLIPTPPTLTTTSRFPHAP